VSTLRSTSETVKPDAARSGSLVRRVESIAKPAEPPTTEAPKDEPAKEQPKKDDVKPIKVDVANISQRVVNLLPRCPSISQVSQTDRGSLKAKLHDKILALDKLPRALEMYQPIVTSWVTASSVSSQ